jgi:hypothetical protein
MATHEEGVAEIQRLLDAGDMEGIERLLEEARAEGARKQLAQEAAHAAFHGRPIRTVVVERRRGYKGRAVCADCYYVREWR